MAFSILPLVKNVGETCDHYKFSKSLEPIATPDFRCSRSAAACNPSATATTSGSATGRQPASNLLASALEVEWKYTLLKNLGIEM